MRNVLLGIPAVPATYFHVNEAGEIEAHESCAHVSGMSIYIPEFHPQTVGGSAPTEFFDESSVKALAQRVLALRADLSGSAPRYLGQSGAARAWSVEGEFEGHPFKGTFYSSYGNRSGWNPPILEELVIGDVSAPDYFGVEELSLGMRPSFNS